MIPFFKKKLPAVVEQVDPVPTTGISKDRFKEIANLWPHKDDAARFSACMEKTFKRSHSDLSSVGVAMDSDIKVAMDSNIQQVKSMIGQNHGFLPLNILETFTEQGFVGWQVCGILAQNWLINKACALPGRDAVRHGFELSANDGEEVDSKVFDKIRKFDKKFKLRKNLMEHHKFARVFGIRHTLFLVDGIDYEAPFNIDGVKPGAYKGMTQIDPYWVAPMFSPEDAADPYSQHFYDPTWWMLGGKKIHRSHFVISRNGNDLADILKPAYFYGGLPTTQLIFNRVYAAERTANEAPMLAMTKRLLTLTTDTTKAMGDLSAFKVKLTEWMALINNFGLKILGADEKVDQIDTSLSGLDETIMTQYQLVAAIADVPATKLLGTSPKGFGASGDYEMKSYAEFLESVQENELSPIVERHTMLVQKSEGIAPDTNLEVQWLPVMPLTAKEQAEVNYNKAQTGGALISAGVIDAIDERKRLIADRDSGYNGLEEIVEGMPGTEEGDPEDEEQSEVQEAKNPAEDALVTDEAATRQATDAQIRRAEMIKEAKNKKS